ncbi:MAG: orotidine-5'-phosphate decarboxylase [Coriobacteriales bacterium]|nr:orotidine-5'-phosphate decarboxylase [Coriobacteriales bacterium]
MLSVEQAQDAIIVALDMGADDAVRLCQKLSGRARWVKVGMTLYYACGPQIVDRMHQLGFNVFLDLKLHVIPFQVEGAAEAASLAGADILSIHALGSSAMVAGARRGVQKAAQKRDSRTKLVAISVLTSMDQDALHEIGIEVPVKDEVAKLASLAVSAGSDGIVCSPQEAAQMRQLLGPDALIVTPGVRPAGSAIGDQKRVATPAAAIAAGASKLVIGRPITKAEDPVAAFDAIVNELTGSAR